MFYLPTSAALWMKPRNRKASLKWYLTYISWWKGVCLSKSMIKIIYQKFAMFKDLWLDNVSLYLCTNMHFNVCMILILSLLTFDNLDTITASIKHLFRFELVLKIFLVLFFFSWQIVNIFVTLLLRTSNITFIKGAYHWKALLQLEWLKSFMKIPQLSLLYFK